MFRFDLYSRLLGKAKVDMIISFDVDFVIQTSSILCQRHNFPIKPNSSVETTSLDKTSKQLILLTVMTF